VQVSAGTALVLPDEPVKPTATDALGATLPVQLTLRTVTFAPVWVGVPPHMLLIVWPLANVHVTVQPASTDVPVLVTVNSAWNPPDHWPVTR
jgi:hypothetical protein